MEKRDKLIIVGLIIVIIALITGLAFMLMDNTSPKQESQINILGNSTVSEGDAISVKLSSNGTVLKDEILHVSILNGSGDEILYKSVKTNSKGMANFVLENLSAGTYNMNVTFRGDGNYSANTTSKEITVMEIEVVEEPITVQESSSNDNSITYDEELNVYYDSNRVIVDPDGHHSMEVGRSYDEILEHAEYVEKYGM